MSTPTKNINAEKIQGNLSINSITATTISATTYQNLPIDIRVTGGTYNNSNTFTYTNNTGGTFNVLFNTVSGLTVNGSLTATTINGNGSNISGINFSQLATTAHTHTISEVTNLQTNLDSKIDKPSSPYFGDYLYYNGITWVPNPINIPVSAGDGVTLFLSTTGGTLMGYEYLSKFPTQITEVQESVVVNNNQTLIHEYATNQLNRTVIDAGIWEFNTFASVDIPSTGLTQIIISAFLLSTGGSETFLFSSATENITTTAATLYTFSLVEPQYSCTTTDYLVVKYSAATTNNFNTTVTLYHGGSLNYSHIHTPFITLHNDLAGIQGGLSNDYYHLSKNQTDLLTTGVDASSIHNHDSLYLGLGGGTVTGSTIFSSTLSASTYLGLPQDVFVTGGTYSNGTTTFTNNTGGTFNVTGFFTGSTDVFTTGATYNNENRLTFTNNTGGTFNVLFNTFTGITSNTISATTYQNLPIDIRVTGGTFSNGTATFTNNTGGTFNVTGFFPGSQDIFTTGATYNNANTLTFTNNTGGTFNVLFNTVTGLTVNGDTTITGNNTVNGTISGNTIFSTQSSGDEGGQLDLLKPQTNTTISGSSVSIDVYKNKVRIFESGGNNRGAYMDITDADTGLTNNLLSTVIYKNVTPVTISASTGNILLQSIFIPANTFRAGDLVEVSFRIRKVGINGQCNIRVNVNTSLTTAGQTFVGASLMAANSLYASVFRTMNIVTNNNNTELFPTNIASVTDYALQTQPITNANIDWTVDQYMFTQVGPASSADTVTSTYLLIKRIR